MPSILQGPACQAFLRRPMRDPQRAARWGGCDEADFENYGNRFPGPSWPSWPSYSGVPWKPWRRRRPGTIVLPHLPCRCRPARSTSVSSDPARAHGPSFRSQTRERDGSGGPSRSPLAGSPRRAGGSRGNAGPAPSRVDVVLSFLKVRPEDGRSPGGDPDRIRKKLPGAEANACRRDLARGAADRIR